MNFKLDTSVNTINLTPVDTVNILKYLPIEDKNNIIYLALQNADENGIFNPLKLQMFFELYTVYSYSDLEFTDEERNDETLLYNILKSNGIVDAIINNIPEEERKNLYSKMEEAKFLKEKYRGSISAVIGSFMENLVPNAEKAAEIIKNFNPESFEQVMNFVKAINNGNLPQ